MSVSTSISTADSLTTTNPTRATKARDIPALLAAARKAVATWERRRDGRYSDGDAEYDAKKLAINAIRRVGLAVTGESRVEAGITHNGWLYQIGRGDLDRLLPDHQRTSEYEFIRKTPMAGIVFGDCQEFTGSDSPTFSIASGLGLS
jgi:hypothetical protein